MKRISLIAMMAILFTSCGKTLSEITSAPKSQNQAGIIASCTSKAQAQSLAESHGVQYRVINEKRKLIEFYNISESDLRAALPKAKTKRNKVYDMPLVQGENFTAQSGINYPFYGSHSREERNSNVSSFFPFLSQIDAHDFVSGIKGNGVTIAIIDTGVYYNHPHISPNIKVNSADRHGSQGDGYDNDGNGYVDDYAGWDFYNGDAYPIDDHGHGTHVAGLSAGTLGGIAPRAKILPIKVLSSQGRGDLGTIAAGILYAIDNGADIINLSLGGPAAGEITNEIQNLLNKVRLAKQNDVLLVAAAGNGGTDGIGDCNDAAPIYPASFDESNLISVASVDSFNQLTTYSNFGGNSVHVAAPGGSTMNGGLLSLGMPNCFGPCSQSTQPYTKSSGTSMATPIVAGIAALIKDAKPSLNHQQIVNILMGTGVNVPELEGLIQSGQVVNARDAVLEALN
jgi:subtilisin family serine protease